MKPVAVKPKVFADLEALSQAAADHVLEAANVAIATRGTFHIALAGGSTPRRLYALLAETEHRKATEWSRWEIWFGDERCVPPDHADSNYRMARESFLEHVPIPPDQVHPMVGTSGDPAADAAAYEKTMDHILTLAGDTPIFDMILLGMGDDGHTASLFPGTDILEITDRNAAAVHVAEKDAWRISLTYPVLDRAREIMFLAAGAGKAGVIARIIGQPEAPAEYPVERVEAQGKVSWYLDSAAAGEL